MTTQNTLENKIANIMGVQVDETIKTIAKGWMEFTKLGMQQGLSFQMAEEVTYSFFKNDTDSFADFCKYINA